MRDPQAKAPAAREARLGAEADVATATISSLQAGYLGGSSSARAVVDAYLRRISALDRDGPRLNSILTLEGTATARADELDAELARTGRFAGPLHGVPVVVKDILATAGTATTFGSPTARANVPAEDAAAVAALRRAGAIVLAKTTLPDFAMSRHSISTLSGVTRNPYALERDAGGSSSGTAVAVAAGLACAGLGSDTGGSARIPASFCGVVGVRVTSGLISRDGMAPFLALQDTPAPMARTVADAAALLDALIVGGIDTPGRADPQSTARPDTTPSLAGRRIGVVRAAFGPDHDAECSAVNAIFRTALSTLERAGTHIVEIVIDDLARSLGQGDLYLSRVRYDLDRFLSSQPGIAADAVADVCRANAAHPALDLLARVARGPARPEDDPTYRRRLAARKSLHRQVAALMTKHRVAALCFPDVRIPPPPIADVFDGRWSRVPFLTNGEFAGQLGMPALSLPAGWTPDGLPVGMELMGLPFTERSLLQLAASIEHALDAARPPALTADDLPADRGGA